jgi:nicotinate (nicotinamide) nucleotide adenylyltransferase
MMKKTSDPKKYSHKIGIMGGAFDPIHYGHLLLAVEALDALSLTEVLFIPTGTSPHKTVAGGATAEQRFEMTRMAIQKIPEFKTSRIEIDRKGQSRTIDTLIELQARRGDDASFYLLLGMDSLRDFPNWKDPVGIQKRCTLVVAKRSGCPTQNRERKSTGEACSLSKYAPDRYCELYDPRQNSRGKRIDFLLPDEVNQYIKQNRIYLQQ